MRSDYLGECTLCVTVYGEQRYRELWAYNQTHSSKLFTFMIYLLSLKSYINIFSSIKGLKLRCSNIIITNVFFFSITNLFPNFSYNYSIFKNLLLLTALHFNTQTLEYLSISEPTIYYICILYMVYIKYIMLFFIV